MKNKAFTLIELLVVIAIIGILATVVLTSLGSARERARDARRKTDIHTIQQALEVYYLDHGKYPTTGWEISNAGGTGNWGTQMVNAVSDLPVDPTNDATSVNDIRNTPWERLGYAYYSANNAGWCYGQAYMLVYNLETEDGTGPEDGLRTCNYNYTYGEAFVVGVSPEE